MVGIGDRRQLCHAGFKINRHFRACSSGSCGNGRNRGHGFAHALNFPAHILDGFARRFNFFAELLHLFASVQHNLLNNTTEFLQFFLMLFFFCYGFFDFAHVRKISALVNVAICIHLFYLFLNSKKRFRPVARCLNSSFQRGLFFRQQFGVGGVKFQRLIHIAQGSLCFLGVCVYRLQRLVKPLGFAVKFDSNALDAL